VRQSFGPMPPWSLRSLVAARPTHPEFRGFASRPRGRFAVWHLGWL